MSSIATDAVDYRIKLGTKATRVFALSGDLYPVNINKSCIVSIFYNLISFFPSLFC